MDGIKMRDATSMAEKGERIPCYRETLLDMKDRVIGG